MVLLMFYLLTPLSVTLAIIVKGHSSVKIFNWNLYVLIWIFVGLLMLSTSSGIWIYYLFVLTLKMHIQRRWLKYFLIWSKLLCWPFLGCCQSKVFKTSHDYNLAWDLHWHFKFDNLVSRSQVCQKHTLQIVCFRVMSTVNIACMPNIMCLTCMYSKETRGVWSVKCLGLAKTLTWGFSHTP